MKRLSSYELGAFEALEWVWHMLRNQRSQSGSVEEVYRSVQEILSRMGGGGQINFQQEIKRLH